MAWMTSAFSLPLAVMLAGQQAEFDCQRGMTGYAGNMKKLLALLVALASAWVLFLPLDLPPFPFFFLDEALALVLLTKSLRYLGFDIAPWLPHLPRKKSTRAAGKKAAPASKSTQDSVIDV